MGTSDAFCLRVLLSLPLSSPVIVVSPDKRNRRGFTALYSQVWITVIRVSNSSKDELVNVPSLNRRTFAK